MELFSILIETATHELVKVSADGVNLWVVATAIMFDKGSAAAAGRVSLTIRFLLSTPRLSLSESQQWGLVCVCSMTVN